jgi:hypothetical protein
MCEATSELIQKGILPMATRVERLAEFTTDNEPRPHSAVELLCEDHRGTYVLPFPCHRTDGAWVNTDTDEELQVEVIGWRAWHPQRCG